MSARTALGWAILASSACACATAPSAGIALATPSGATERRSPAPADTHQVTKLAHSAQSRFETIRRNHFTRTMSWGSHPCDEIVGRFCLWHVDDDDRRIPPPEREAVSRSRNELLARFDTLASILPSDPWIAGHRVRYLLEAGRSDEALDAARACRAESWWCLALEGYALHGAERFLAADSAFAAALRAMPYAERCRWTDVSLLLDDDRARRDYRHRGCDDRVPSDERFWWLADPFWMIPGNDRRTEHYARHVLDLLQEQAASGFGMLWEDDLSELLVRYGWPASWEREWGRPGTLGPGSIVAHHAPGARTFDPPAAILDDPTLGVPRDWPLDPPRPRTEYKTPYADAIDVLEHQLAFFPRGDSAIAVVAYDAGDSIAPSERVDAALVLARSARQSTLAGPSHVHGPSGVIITSVAPGATVVSVEAVARTSRRAARARYGVTVPSLAPEGLSLSDLLLFRPADSLPATIDDAAPLALASSRVVPGQRLGVYWEVSGAPVGETVDVAMSLEREGKSWLRKTFEWIGLAKDRSLQTRLAWGEEIPSGSVRARSLAIDLSDLDRGVYRITVAVSDVTGQRASMSRTLIVQ